MRVLATCRRERDWPWRQSDGSACGLVHESLVRIPALGGACTSQASGKGGDGSLAVHLPAHAPHNQALGFHTRLVGKKVRRTGGSSPA